MVEVTDDRTRFLPLMLLADESESVVRGYIGEGELFAIRDGDRDVGVLQLIAAGNEVEIKNLAVADGERRRGVGTFAVRFAVEHAKEAGAARLIVGTAETSEDAIAFYHSVGFRRSGVREGFFDTYPEPIWERGARARDMLMFELPLT